MTTENTNHDLIVVVPVYNEEGSIGQVLGKWHETFSGLEIDFEIHVYDDGSQDNSYEIIEKVATRLGQIVPHRKRNSGHGPTILLGYRNAQNAEWVFQVDSDDEMSPDYFKTLWVHRDSYDLLIGKRVNRASPLSRSLVSIISRAVVRIFYGDGCFDVNCPYRLMRNSCFREFFLALPNDTFAPNVILVGVANSLKFRFYETEIPYMLRTTGQVSIKKMKLLKAAIKACYQTLLARVILHEMINEIGIQKK